MAYLIGPNARFHRQAHFHRRPNAPLYTNGKAANTRMARPKIIIIIPTRERSDVLKSSLQTATSQDYENLEIIVSDNCSQDQTRDVVAANGDPRITYLNTGRRLSMSANWEFALSHARDGWVTFMGDDDGLVQGAVRKVAEIIDATSADAIRSAACTYEWPQVAGKPNGTLVVPMGSGMAVRESARWLKKALLGVAKYSDLPMVYNGGFIKTSVFERLKTLSGAYFRSASPDTYSAISIASITNQYVYLREPLSISGVSRHSTGNSYHSVRSDRNRSPALAFASEGNIPFHADVPMQRDGSYPLSLHALLFEAYLQSQSLRSGTLGINHAQQLEIILATTKNHQAPIREWGQAFAELHGLDFERALRGSSLRALLLGLYARSDRAVGAWNSVLLDGPAIPLVNVYQASIAASVVLARPARRRRFTLALKRRLVGKR